MSGNPYDVRRVEWEEPAFSIDRYSSSPPVDWDRVEGVTIHYPASTSISGRPTEGALISHLRAAQRSYVNDRGYSYGYNAVVWEHLAGEVRGDAFRNAANGAGHNTDRFSIQVRVPGRTTADSDTSTPASDRAVRRVRELVEWCQEQAGRRLVVDGHRDHKPTGCPGDAMYAQLEDGLFIPRPDQQEDSLMTTIRIDGYADQFLAIPLSADTHRRLGLPGNGGDIIASTDLTRAQLEAILGYQLTPLT